MDNLTDKHDEENQEEWTFNMEREGGEVDFFNLFNCWLDIGVKIWKQVYQNRTLKSLQFQNLKKV